jgi:hypothetical protein
MGHKDRISYEGLKYSKNSRSLGTHTGGSRKYEGEKWQEGLPPSFFLLSPASISFPEELHHPKWQFRE